MNKTLKVICWLLWGGVIPLNVQATTEGATCDVLAEMNCTDTSTDNSSGNLVLGVGIGSALGVPEYIGSDEMRNFLLPLPYVSYNGPRLKVSQSGITGKLFNSDKWFLSLSLSGAIPVSSKDNAARAGMEDLEAVFEYGPSLKYFFIGNDNAEDALFFDFNFREARTISFDSLDINASPSLVWRNKLPKQFWGGELKFTSRFRWEFISGTYADYFYGVAERDVTDFRQAYDANGGFAGYRINNSLRWQRDNIVVSMFVGYANVSGAEFADSPLVKRHQHLFAGGAFFWLFDW